MIGDMEENDRQGNITGAESTPPVPERQTENVAAVKEIPSVKESILILILTAVFILGIMIVLAVFTIIIGSESVSEKEFLLIEALFIVPAVIYAMIRGYSLKKIFRLNPVSLRTVMISVVLGFCIILIVNFLETWLSFMPGGEWLTEWQQELQQEIMKTLIYNNAYEFAVLTFSVVIAAALCEEMLFRGLFQQSLEHRVSFTAAILITAIAFTLLHPFSFIPILVLAVTLGVMGWKSNSIYPTIVIHALNNGLSLYSLNMSETPQKMSEEGLDVPFYVFLIALIVFGYGMKAFFRETSQKENEEI